MIQLSVARRIRRDADRLYGTTTTVMTSGSPSDETVAVTFTATVATNNLPFAPPGGTIPQGTVQFLDGATPITCSEGGTSIQTLNGSSQATCTTSTLTAAGSPHTINVNYCGNGNFDPSSGIPADGERLREIPW